MVPILKKKQLDPPRPMPLETAPADPPARAAIENLTIHLPLGEPSPIDRGLHVDVQLWEAQQRLAFRRLRAGLQDGRATLANGAVVKTGADCIRWLLDQVAQVAG